MAVTSSNLNRFSKFFYTGKRAKFPIKHMYHFPPHLKFVAALPWGILKFKFIANLEENANKKCHINLINQLSFHRYQKKKAMNNL